MYYAPTMMVESQCHIMAEAQAKYPRAHGPNPPAWVRDLSGEDFLRLIIEAGVERAILVQAFGAYRYDNNYVADAAARFPDRFVAVGIVDVVAPDAADKLTYWVKERGV